jgi:hypothetical protein
MLSAVIHVVFWVYSSLRALTNVLRWVGYVCWTELIEKTESRDDQRYSLFKSSAAHILPLTNCAFNKSGDKCVRS